MKWVKRIGLVILALILIPPAALLIMGMRSGAGQIHQSVEIAASPDQLWPWVSDGDKLKQWVSWLVDVRGQGASGVGAKRIWVMRDENNGGQQMEIQGTLSRFAPPNELTVDVLVPDTFDGSQTYRLTGLGNGRTRLDIDGKYHFQNKFAQLMEPLITPSASKKLGSDVARLKSLVETKAEVR